jgi:hypothetical protein
VTDEYAVLFGDKFQLGDVAPLPEFKDEILFAAVGDFRCLECRFDKGIDGVEVFGGCLSDGHGKPLEGGTFLIGDGKTDGQNLLYCNVHYFMPFKRKSALAGAAP